MSDDALQGSEWDDAISANPRPMVLEHNLAEELANTLGRDDDHRENETPEEEEEEEEEEQDEHIEQDEDAHDDDEPVHVPQEKAEPKDTSGLLSTLTDGDKGFISESIVSPKKDEALFKDSGSAVKLPGLTNGSDSHDAASSTVTSSSPSKVRLRNMYRAPRHRRTQLPESASHQHTTGTIASAPLGTSSADDGTDDPMGPLGGSEQTSEVADPEEISGGDSLFQQADGPLFHINRTPLSPLKKIPSSQVETTGSEGNVKEKEKPTKKELQVKMEISVGDPIKVGELTGAHIAYSVRTNSDSDLFKTPQTVVSRRYRDFRWLYRQLQSTHPGRIVPPPPDKQAVGRFNEDFIEGRRFALERMLKKISENPVLHNDPDFIMFLQSERFSSEAREREKAAGASSIFTEHESDSMNSNSGGFLSSIGGAFSFTPKIIEPEDYFKDKKSYIEGLSQQYKVFLKNLETIIIQRHDLASVTVEFANIIETLADLEISKGSTEIFQEFAATEMRLKELLDRLSLQDMLTLGATLDEYMRIINSIKTVFQQRDKVLVQLSVAETDLKKKQASLDKYVKYNRTQTEKIGVIKSELTAIEQRYKATRERFDEIGNTIREELATFEVEKIHDFRNTVEIFLESTIESQKEAVELWETFYNMYLTA